MWHINQSPTAWPAAVVLWLKTAVVCECCITTKKEKISTMQERMRIKYVQLEMLVNSLWKTACEFHKQSNSTSTAAPSTCKYI